MNENKILKNILCFGDSNTWGFCPETQNRYPWDVRWTGCLQTRLGSGYRIIEEGQGGRTTVWDDPIEKYKNGEKYLLPCLETHSPLDMVILMLGGNDLKKRFSLSAFDIAEGAANLVRHILYYPRVGQDNPPRVLLISPAQIGDNIENSDLFGMFDSQNSYPTSRQLAPYYKRVAEKYSCLYLDAAEIVEIDPLDSVHFTALGHKKLADAIEVVIRAAF